LPRLIVQGLEGLARYHESTHSFRELDCCNRGKVARAIDCDELAYFSGESDDRGRAGFGTCHFIPAYGSASRICRAASRHKHFTDENPDCQDLPNHLDYLDNRLSTMLAGVLRYGLSSGICSYAC